MGVRLEVFFVLAGIACIFGDGRFVVITHPEHTRFVNTENNIDSLEIPYLIANLFGIPNTYELKWNGLLEGNPFIKPKAMAFFSIFYKESKELLPFNAQKSYGTSKKSNVFDEELINHMIQQTAWEKEPLIIETSLENQLMDIKSTFDGESQSLSLDKIMEEIQSSRWLEKHRIKFLNVSSDADLVVLGELYGITKVIEMLKKNLEFMKNPSPDFYHFKIIGLRGLEDEEKTREAWNLLQDVIAEVTQAFKDLYQNNVVVAAVAISSEPGFSADIGRRLKSYNELNKEQINQAPEFTALYPVMFNIILWFSIAFFLTMVFVSWGIWHMDPGRDSVIYRMTTQRLKRD